MPIEVAQNSSLAAALNITTEDRLEALAMGLEQCRTVMEARAYWSDWHEQFDSARRRNKLGNHAVWQQRLRMIEARISELRNAG